MMEIKQPTTVLERVQNVYQDYPKASWVLMTGIFIDRLGTNLIMPFLAIDVVQHFDAHITQVDLIFTIFAASSGVGNFLAGALMDRFDPRWVWFGCSLICAISIVGFYGLHLHTKERLNEKQEVPSLERKKGIKDAV